MLCTICLRTHYLDLFGTNPVGQSYMAVPQQNTRPRSKPCKIRCSGMMMLLDFILNGMLSTATSTKALPELRSIREIVLQTCKMLDACYKPDADRRADLMKAKDDSIQLLQQQLDDLVVVRARGEIEQDKFLQRTIEIQQQMEALRQSKAQIASEDYNPGRLDMEAIEAALCEAVEMHDGLVSEDFIDLFVSQVTPLSDSRFAWCLDFSPQPTVAFLNLAGQRKYTTCSMDSKLHFGPFADEEGHTIPFPGSLRR